MKRNYKKEYKNYHGKPKQKANRNSRNKARRKMVNSGKIKKSDTRDGERERITAPFSLASIE